MSSGNKLVHLDGETVRFLSCSQVITSIHVVVKELVENSLDAGATSIEITLGNYGLDVIEVRDNGFGVKKDDIPFMALPHCTSKISSFCDLCTLETYGFRGEALHSMAGMGSLSITSRTEEDDVATMCVFNSSGHVVCTKASHLARGTTVCITDLFKDFPVRRQHYKSPKHCKVGLKRVENYLYAFGICHPDVRFQLSHNTLTLWQKLWAPNFEVNAMNILGPVLFHQMSPLNYQCFDPMVKIQALVPKPHGDVSNLTRSTPDKIHLLINKRPVIIKPLVQLVKLAFSEAHPSLASRYPIAIVNINVLPQALDVNLEPNKTSVLLHDLDMITSTLGSLLSQVYSPSKLMAVEKPVITNKVNALFEEECLEKGDKADKGVEEQVKVGEYGMECGTVEKSTDALGFDKNEHESFLEPKDTSLEDELFTSEMTSDEMDGQEATTDHTSKLKEIGCNLQQESQMPLQVTLSQWSRGQSCGALSKIQPVQVCRPQASPVSPTQTASTSGPLSQARSKLTHKGPSQIFDMINSWPVKRKVSPKLESSKKQKQLLSYKERSAPPSEKQALYTANCQLQFDIAGVTGRNSQRHSREMTDDGVIGRCGLESSGDTMWLVVHDSSIALFNAGRARDETGEAACSLGNITDVQKLLARANNTQLFHCLHKV